MPKCPLGQAQAGDCPASTLVGNIKTTLGSGDSLFTVPGKLYLAEPARPGDVASIVATVPAKAGVPDPQTGKYPIDLGPDVVIVNRLLLREADTGVDVILRGRLPRRRRRSATGFRRCSRACRCRSARSRSRSTARASS